MALQTIDCTINNWSWYYMGIEFGTGNVFEGWNLQNSVFLGTQPYGNNFLYDLVLIKFTTPSYMGTCKSIHFDIVGEGPGEAIMGQYRYAIATSNSYKDSYIRTGDPVSEPSQIESGIIDKYDGIDVVGSNKYSFAFECDTDKLKPNTVYYLYLWPKGTTSKDTRLFLYRRNGTFTLKYANGLAYIDNGVELVPYQTYIDNGVTLDLYTPYIDNGTGWDIYS